MIDDYYFDRNNIESLMWSKKFRRSMLYCKDERIKNQGMVKNK